MKFYTTNKNKIINKYISLDPPRNKMPKTHGGDADEGKRRRSWRSEKTFQTIMYIYDSQEK